MTRKKKPDGEVLSGMRDICRVLKRSEATVLDLKRKHPDMPIKKSGENGGVWSSHSGVLLEWWAEYVATDL